MTHVGFRAQVRKAAKAHQPRPTMASTSLHLPSVPRDGVHLIVPAEGPTFFGAVDVVATKLEVQVRDVRTPLHRPHTEPLASDGC